MIGIIGAMEEEVAALKEVMELQETVEQASMIFSRGILCGKEAVVVRSGIGKVNAGICAQILIDRFHVDTLINTGIAGSLDARIDIGDMVISTDALYHDMDATKFGYPVGQVPRMETLSFPADENLVKKAVEANQKANRIFIHLPEGSQAETSLLRLRRSRRILQRIFIRSVLRWKARG